MFMKNISIILCVVGAVLANDAPLYPAPVPYKHNEYLETHPQYSYSYGVEDDLSGNNFGHSESRDGFKTEGSYFVNLPDGRKQIVTYADHGEGLVAEVTYEGEAYYPEYNPVQKPGGLPAYGPPPPPGGGRS